MMWWFFTVLLCLYGLYCFAFCGSMAYTAFLEDWCGWRARRRREAYVELSETEPMLEGIGYGMQKKRDGYVMDLFEERFDVSETGPPIIPTGDPYGDGGPIFF